MSYEIPQQLQHKEKIIFGLTFTQLGWATLFGGMVLLILTRKGSIITNLILAVVPALLGLIFVIFDVNKWFKSIFKFFTFRKATLNSSNMLNLVGVRKIKDGIVFSDKELALLQVTPMNFGIKTIEEQNGIMVGFQKFLNSLDFPIQFVMTTSIVNLDSYLNELKERANNQDLFNDFSDFIKKTISDNQMRNRLFYIVIPKQSDLNIQANICKERLESMGLKATRLTDKGLLKSFYTFFNGLGGLREPKEAISNGVHYLIAPDSIEDLITCLSVNEDFNAVVTAVGYPRLVESGFLDKIISSNDNFDISIHVEPFSIESMMIMLNRELQKQRADLFAEKVKNSLNPSLEIKYEDTRKVLEALQKGNEKLFNVSLYINCKAKKREDLALLIKKVESELNSLMIVPQTPIFRQISAYKSMIPIAKDELKVKRNITTSALSAFFPFTSPFLTVDQKGVMLGLNKNKVPFIKDIFGLSNANGLILATSGSGKSYFTKLLISRQMLNGTKVIVIDPQSEYLGLIGQCKGELITISRNSETIINPLDLMGHDFIEKRLMLMDLFKVMFGDLTEIQKSILDRALTETYALFKITADSYENKTPPILSDLYSVLVRMEKKASKMEKITYRALINRLYMYTDGVFGFLNKQSSIDFDNDFVCFNIGDMPKQVKPVIMFLILDYVYMKMKETKERKLLVVDEAWSLLGQTEEASYLFEIVKTCRKFNLGLLLITQDVADLVNSRAGHAVLANSSYSLLLRQKPAIIDSVVKTFHLSQMEKDYLLTATQGKGILIMDNDHQELEVVASPKEHELITTNADEIVSKSKKIKLKVIKDKDELDIDEGLYYGMNLSMEQKNILSNHGYLPSRFVRIGKTNSEECWVKTNKVESIGHTFLVQNIKQEIHNYTKKVKVSITEEPDLVFENSRGVKIALEIENGDGFKKKRNRLLEKFLQLNKKYGKNFYVILTSKDYKERYGKLGNFKIMLRSDVRAFLSANFKTKK